jgi:predicted MFS family arabinose efflux permease
VTSIEPSALEPRALSRASAWALALVATFTMAVSYIDRQTLAVLSPDVCSALGIDETRYGWLLSAFSIAYLVGAPLAGRLLDRVGARRGLLGAVAVWSLIAALHALAPSFAALFALRVALGLAESPSFPGAAQTIHRALPPSDQPRAFGVLFTGSSFGAMLAPPLATGLAAAFGFRAAFVGTALVGLCWIPVWLAVAYRRDARAALDRAPRLAGGARAASTPWLTLVTHPAVVRALLVTMASAPALGYYLNWGSKLLVRHHGLTTTQTGAYMWLPPVLFDLGSIAFGSLASAHARRTKLAPARLVLFVAMLLGTAGAALPLAATAGGPWLTMLVAGVAMAGGGGLYAIATSDMLCRVPAEAVSSASGLTAAMQSAMLIVTSPLVGRSIDLTKSHFPAIVALSLWVVPGCLAWLRWRPPPATAE